MGSESDGRIPAGWEEKPLIDCTSDKIISYGIVQPGSQVDNGIPIVRVNNFSGGNLDLTSPLKVDPQIEKSFMRTRLNGGEVLLTLVGSTGQSVVAPSNLKGWNVARAIAVIRPHEDVGAKWIDIVLKSKAAASFLDAHANTTVQKTLNLKDVKRLPVLIPPKEIKQFIESCITCLDDKIELNRQMNTTLEAMAQALFKSWFVDFDPVIDNALAAGNEIPEELAARAERRAKAAQQQSPEHPHTLPAAIRQQFPDRFVFTETMGWVPEGWGAVALNTLTSKIGSGATPRGGSQVYIEDGVSLIRSQNVYDSKFVWEGLAHITDEAAAQLKGVTVLEGDVLLNITGASILRTCIVSPAALPARVNQHVSIVRPRPGIPSKYLHLHLLNASTKRFLMGQNAGASREAVTKSHIESVPTLDPGAEVLAQFAKLVSSFQDCADNCNSTVRSLSALRDQLLPKLLSGQLRIPEAEQLLAEAL